MRWIDTISLDDAKRRSDALWKIVEIQTEDGARFGVDNEGLSEQGVFWADHIKKFKDKPKTRLEIALRHLPLPGAFREAAIALRAQIKQAEARSEDTDQLLEGLHQLAAVESFSIPYSKRLGVSGFNVMERIPYSEFKKMDLSWRSIGGERLRLLNKTDIKRMTAKWGPPKANLTSHTLYRDVWAKYEGVYENEQKSKKSLFLEALAKFGSHKPNSD